MFRKIFVYTLFFYFLALLQTSVLAGFDLLNIINLISIFVIFINLFESPRDYAGIYAGFIGGFFWDIFSANFIGQNALIFLALALFIKIVLRKYVWAPAI
ncbi:MAG: rod shape-determining protein MreD [bacterium]|nr:rod shape-determining protein MreD [bacterium]